MIQKPTDEIRKLVEFDEFKCDQSCDPKMDAYNPFRMYINGARWQHSQLLPIIEVLLQDRERLVEALSAALVTIKYPLLNELLNHETDIRRMNYGSDQVFCALKESETKLREALKLEKK